MLPAVQKLPKGARRILVVDDNLDHVRSLVLLLRQMGHVVDYAINGIVAIETAARYRPEVVLLDLGLPDAHGAEVARQIRAIAGLGSVRLVAVTGRTSEEDHRRAAAAGCDAILVKPVSPSALEDAISERPG